MNEHPSDAAYEAIKATLKTMAEKRVEMTHRIGADGTQSAFKYIGKETGRDIRIVEINFKSEVVDGDLLIADVAFITKNYPLNGEGKLSLANVTMTVHENFRYKIPTDQNKIAQLTREFLIEGKVPERR